VIVDLLYFFLAYAAAVIVMYLTNKSEFAEHPEKRARYEALPLGYKLACWLGVLPVLAGATYHEGFFGIALVSAILLESACKRWYRKAGLY
jgi:hypothetical protein